MTSDEFATRHLAAAQPFAAVLTGDRTHGDDLVQEVLVRAHARWRRIGSMDASTYLEVQEATIEPRTVIHLLHKPRIVWACYSIVGWSAATTSVDWLPPTKQNRALLNLTPPAGFTQVANQQIAQYLGPYS